MTRSATKLSVLALVLVTALVASVAKAAVYAPIGDSALVGRAREAALVRAVASETGMLAPGLPETRTRFEVIETLRGGLGREVEVGVLGCDVGDGTTLVVPDVPRFEPGRVYLLLLSRRDDGRYGVVEQSLGAFDVVEDEAGTRFATRLSFAGQKTRPVAVMGPDGAARAEREPMRKLTEFAAAIRASQGALATEMAAYAGVASGKTTPVRETRGVSAMWDSNWNGQRARWNPSATAATLWCDALAATSGQSGVAGGGFDELRQAAAEWSNVPGADGAEIRYAAPQPYGAACPSPAQVNSGQVVVSLDDTAVTGVALACGEGGILGTGAWLTDNSSHTWRSESYQTIKAGMVWVRRVDCSEYPTDLFRAVVLHGLGNTLGLSNSDGPGSPHDFDPMDNLNGVMVSFFGPNVPYGLGSDDLQGACWLYGWCGQPNLQLQAAFTFQNPVRRGEFVTFENRSTGMWGSQRWDFGDGTSSADGLSSHAYQYAGRYTVTLTVTDFRNPAITSTATQQVSVLTDLLPMLMVPGSAEVGSPVTIGLEVRRSQPQGQMPLVQSPAQLDLGDGTSAAPVLAMPSLTTFENTVHTYTQPGVYYVRATVQDGIAGNPSGVSWPENSATAVTAITIYPKACQAPSNEIVMTIPPSVMLGENLLLSWTADPNFDPEIDRYDVQISTVPFTGDGMVAGTGEWVSTRSSFYLHRVLSYPEGGTIRVRVRTAKQCATFFMSAWSNVPVATVERPPTVVSLSGAPGAMYSSLYGGATAKYCYLNSSFSAGSASLALTLEGTDAAAFTTNGTTSLAIAPGQTGCLWVSPTTATVQTAGYRTARLVATYGTPATRIEADVAILVSAATPPSWNTVLRAAESKISFSAPAGQVPAPATLTLTVIPPPQADQTIELAVERKPAWLLVDQPAGGLKFDATGRIVLTLRVDRARREVPGAPQSGDLVLGVAATNPLVTVALPVLDVEPWPVQEGPIGRSSVAGPVPLGATTSPAESPGSFFVASAVEADGLFGASFSSDGWLRNSSDVDGLPVEFWFTPAGRNGLTDSGVLLARTTVAASRTLRLSSMLSTVFGLPKGASGMVEVKSAYSGAFTFRSRTQSSTGGDPALLFGAEMPAVAAADGVDAAGGEAVVPGVVSTEAGRTNLVLSNVSNQGATVKVTVRNAEGSASSALSDVYVPPYSRQQVNDVAKAAGMPSLDLGSLAVKVTSGGGRVVPVASIIDNASNSFRLVKGVDVGSGSFRALIVPGLARLDGVNDTRYRTSLHIANGTGTPANLQLVYRYYDVDLGGKPGEAIANVTIAPYGSLPAAKANDVVEALFGLTAQTYGWISIEGEVQKVAAAAAISTQVDNANAAKGRTAAQLAAIPSTSRQIAGSAGGAIRFAGAEKSSVRRSNLVVVETVGSEASVRLVLSDAVGRVLGVRELAVKPYEYVQINDLFGPAGFNLGEGPFSDAEVAVKVTAGAGRVLSFVSTIVNSSRNPEIYLLAPSGP